LETIADEGFVFYLSPMSRTPDEEKRRRILQVSYEAFGELGYKRTTIKHIADRAGIAPGSIYTYFHDKDALFLCAISDIWDRFSRAALEATENQQIPFRRRAEALFSVGEELIRRSRRLLNGIFAVPERRDLLRRNLESACRHLVPFFDEGRQLGLTLVGANPSHYLYEIRILLSGVLWDLALVDGAAFETELLQARQAWYRELDKVQS
jgi:AcrR family transcriptional regulator